MDVHFELNGVSFIWHAKKALANASRHGGVTFESAAEVFFDPFVRVVDASRNDEARDAAAVTTAETDCCSWFMFCSRTTPSV